MLQHVLKAVHSSVSVSTQSAHLDPLEPLDDDDTNDDGEFYSTPPTTPMTPSPRSATSSATAFSETYDAMTDSKKELSPAVSRRSSRPSSLLIEKQGWTPDIQLIAGSPEAARGNTGSKPDDDKSHSATRSDESPAPSHPLASTTGLEKQSAFTPSSEHYSSPAVNPVTATSAFRLNSDSSIMDNHKSNAESKGSSCLETTNNGNNASSSSLSTLSRPSTASTGSSTVTPNNASIPLPNRHHQHQQLQPQYQPPLTSPCFVHSFLDKGASLTDWLNIKKSKMMGVPHPITSQSAPPQSNQTQFEKHPHHHHHLLPHVQAPHPAIPLPQPVSPPGSSPDSDLEDEDGASLTRQLAETAVGVREMSKQLGRARVRSNIQNVLIITKARDNRLIKLTRELALYLMQKPRYGGRGLVVYVDNQLRYSKRFDAAGIERDHPELFVPFPRRRSSSSHSLSGMVNGNGQGSDSNGNQEGQLRYWTSDMCNKSPQLFDFVVTLGGDGTVLFTSWLFQRIVPPVLPFALGSLGFLTNFDFADHRAVMDSAIDNGIRVNLRMRFTCTVYRAVAPEPGKGRRAVKKADTGEIMMRNIEKGGWEALEGGWGESGIGVKEGKKSGKDKEIMCFTTRPVESFEVLNDLVVDRGPSPYVSLLELFGDEHHMTTVQADGLTVSTPTGSTAYSLSAGGSLVHPEIPALLITPICPHTLSFRPMLLPDSMELRICVPYNSRSTAWASFDGRGRVELKQGDHIKVTASKYPFPTVCADKQSTDWFHAISRTLKWNERERQKSFVVVEEGPVKQKSGKRGSVEGSVSSVAGSEISEKDEEQDEEDEDDDEEDEEEEEEEEKYDIDDSSAPEASAVPSSTDLVGMVKAQEETRQKREESEARVAALALAQQGISGLTYTTERSGIETPDRFAGAHPHPPRVSPRHVSFGGEYASEASSPTDGSPTLANEDANATNPHPDEKGERDHIHAPHMLSGGRSRIPRDRDVEADSANMKTPTVSSWGQSQSASAPGRAQRSRSRDSSCVRRAFAVWGQDESDSNASDSDV